MSNWPMASDYAGMVQNPKIAFNHPQLQQCKINRDARNLPEPREGRFAVVFEGELPNGTKRAIRAFTSRREGIAERYRLISQHVLDKMQDVEALVSFEYEEKGIRATVNGRSRMYPLVTMDWVTGVPLCEWVGKQCSAGDTVRLQRAADQWLSLINDLASAQIAHGDLQHDNILVDGRDRFRLVDYDGMCVPALVGQENMEIGVAPYQHRDRDEHTRLSLSLDNFSAIFIYVALRALAAEPSLWMDFVVKTNYEKLLFREEDLESPSTSDLYGRLQRSRDPDVVRLTQDLSRLYRGPLKDVPPLGELAFAWTRIERSLDARQFDDVVRQADDIPDINKAPDDLKPRIQDAYRRVKCLQQLRLMVQAGDEEGMMRCHDPTLLDDYPAAQDDVAVARDAPRVIPILDKLRQASQNGRWREFTQIWDSECGLLATRQSAQSFRSDVEQWRPRNQACEVVLRLASQQLCDPDRLQQAWQRLQALGGHPEVGVEGAAYVDHLIERGRAWRDFASALERCGQGPGSEQLERQAAGKWNDDLFKGWGVAENKRSTLTAVRRRLQIVDRVSDSIRQAGLSPTGQGEERIVQAAKGLPLGYDYVGRDRVETAQRRREIATLVTQLARGDDDLQLADRWEELVSLQGQDMVDPSAQSRVHLAVDRAAAWSSFQSAVEQATASPGEQADFALTARWNERVFRGWTPAEQCRTRLNNATTCLAVLDQLDQRLRQLTAVTLDGERGTLELVKRLPPHYEHRHRARADLAEQRLQAARRLPELVRSSAAEEQIRDAWQTLQKLQGSPLIDAGTATRGKLADDRLRIWAEVQNALEHLDRSRDEGHEARLLQLWDENLFHQWPRAEAVRQRMEEARRHDAILGKLRSVACRPLTLQGERSIVQEASHLP
ncbi:MAG: hypothetical protein ABIP48_15380, partial [Planctomycetota bacterium]